MSDSGRCGRAVSGKLRRGFRRPFALLIALTGLVAPAHAHEAFAEYVWHRVKLGVNTRHIDVTVELTFFEEWSVRERQRMDADGDGRIQKAERDAYVRALEREMNRKVALVIGGRRVDLVPLYSPEIDLLGREMVERNHHQLTLRFFAPVPQELTAGATVLVEDRLWLEARSLSESAKVTETDATLESQPVAERPFPATENDPLRFRARVVATMAPAPARQ